MINFVITVGDIIGIIIITLIIFGYLIYRVITWISDGYERRQNKKGEQHEWKDKD